MSVFRCVTPRRAAILMQITAIGPLNVLSTSITSISQVSKSLLKLLLLPMLISGSDLQAKPSRCFHCNGMHLSLSPHAVSLPHVSACAPCFNSPVTPLGGCASQLETSAWYSSNWREEFTDAWKPSCLASTVFHFIAPDKNPASVDTVPIFTKFAAPWANNMSVLLCWPPSTGLFLDVLNIGNLQYVHPL